MLVSLHSASGLGQATVREIVRLGGYVQIIDLNEAAGREMVNDLSPERTNFATANVAETGDIAEAVEKTMSWILQTGKPLGGVIAAAGVGNAAKIIDRHGQPLDLNGFDRVMRVNVRGTIDLIRQFLPYLARVEPSPPDGERGVIVLVSSSAAFDGQPGQVAYAASKGAVASLTLPLTRELAMYGIRVVAIAPSLFDTAMMSGMSAKVKDSLTKAMEFPERPGKPEEFANMVREGLENSMLNGVVIRLDGGVRMPSKI
jgi:NAD(P)-dependent dehydrogenase (short-subunit alcohol dehydrogenase family)